MKRLKCGRTLNMGKNVRIKTIYWVFSSFIELFSVLKCFSNEFYLLTFNWKEPRKKDNIDSKQSSRKRRINSKQKKSEKNTNVFCSCKKYNLSDRWKGVKLASWALKKRIKIRVKKKNQNAKRRSRCLSLAFRKKKKHTISVCKHAPMQAARLNEKLIGYLVGSHFDCMIVWVFYVVYAVASM